MISAEDAKKLSAKKEKIVKNQAKQYADAEHKKELTAIEQSKKCAREFVENHFTNDVKQAIKNNNRSIRYEEKQFSYDTRTLYEVSQICTQLGYNTRVHENKKISNDPDDYDGPVVLVISW